jgi:hypothetical protein
MFLARDPLMDLAHKMMDGIGHKRKSRSRRKTKTTADTEAAK